MPRDAVNVVMVYCVVILLLLSVAWVQMIFKYNAAQLHSSTVDTIKIKTIYDKCKWVFLTNDLQLIMQTLVHLSYKEQVACLKAYINDQAISDLQLKAVTLFKTAMLHKKNSKKITILNIASQDMKEKQLLLKIAATHCQDIIPTLYAWIETHDENYRQQQVSAVYNDAIKNNNPLLFNCLLEYDIPLQPHQASAYLHTVLYEQKHKAFICLLLKAGAKNSTQLVVHNPINNHLGVLSNAKNTFYQELLSRMYDNNSSTHSLYALS